MLPVFSKSSHAIFAAPFSRFLSCIIFPLRQRTSLTGSQETQLLAESKGRAFGGTSCPLSKALITLCRGEMSERICRARTVTENSVHITLFEKKFPGAVVRARSPYRGVEQRSTATELRSGPIKSERSSRPNAAGVPSPIGETGPTLSKCSSRPNAVGVPSPIGETGPTLSECSSRYQPQSGSFADRRNRIPLQSLRRLRRQPPLHKGALNALKFHTHTFLRYGRKT